MAGDSYIFNIQRYSTQDGPGIRTTVFLKGCPLNCLWCHNPEGIPFGTNLTFREERCINCGSCATSCPVCGPLFPGNEKCLACGACARSCPTEARAMSGRYMTVSEVMSEIIRDRIFYDQSGGGVTFSGGEPTAQPEFLGHLLTKCRREDISTAIDTCGYVEKSVLLDLAKKTDLVLYDLKGHDNTRHRSNTGIIAAPVLDNLNALANTHNSIWLRLPIVQGYTDDPTEMELLASRYRSYGSIRRVILLPCHALGESKISRLGIQKKMPGLSSPPSSILDMLAEIWRRHGFDTYIGARQ